MVCWLRAVEGAHVAFLLSHSGFLVHLTHVTTTLPATLSSLPHLYFIWQHTYCAGVWSSALNRHVRTCANTKRLTWKYVDSCTTQGDPPLAGGKSGRNSNFKYEDCDNGCTESCTTQVGGILTQVGGIQVIKVFEDLPNELKEYHEVYGLCSNAALNR